MAKKKISGKYAKCTGYEVFVSKSAFFRRSFVKCKVMPSRASSDDSQDMGVLCNCIMRMFDESF